jgi:cell division protease FtsH
MHALLAAGFLGTLNDIRREFISIVLTWAPVVLIGLLIYLVFRMLKSMPKVNTSASQKPERSTVRWDDVAGVDEPRKELMEIVEFLREPQRFAGLGARIPKGVLLYGPPGTGKTLLARAVAGESSASFFSASGSSFVEVYGGLGSARVRKLFETARKHAPAIVFIDELDAIGSERKNTGNDPDASRTLNQLLVELDGFAHAAGVIVMGSTNRLDTLDPALLRPGRFDRQVLVPPPDIKGRRAILAVHTRDKPLGEHIDLDAIARTTSGLTGADLANLCNEAAIQAGRAHRIAIFPADFEEARERVVAGLLTHRALSENEKRIIAFHESGHALVSHLLSMSPVHKVTIIPRGHALGYAMSLPEEERFLQTREELIDIMSMMLAGRVAESLVFGRVSTAAADDLMRATDVARAMVCDFGMGSIVEARTLRADDQSLSEETRRLRDTEQTRLTTLAYDEARRLLGLHRETLDRIAGRLFELESLDRAELAALVADTPRERAHSDEIGRVLGVAAAREARREPSSG